MHAGLLALVLLASGTEPAIAVVDVRSPPQLAERAAAVRAALESGLGQRRVRVVVDDEALARARASRDAALAEGLTRARALAAEGQRLFDAQDTDGAEKKLREAAQLFEANAAGLDAPDDLVSSLLLLTQIFFATQREVLVRDVLRHIVRLSPDLVLDRSTYPGAMVRAHDEVRGQLLVGPLATVAVESVPPHAQVFLDGRSRGLSPTNIVNVPPGAHALVVRRPGFAAQHRVLDVTAFRVENARIELPADRHPELERVFESGAASTLDSSGRPLAEYLQALAAATNADLLVIGRLVSPTTLELRLWHRASSGATATRTVELPAVIPEALEEASQGLLLDALTASWVGPLAPRRNVAAGGGVLDESTPLGFRVALVPGARVNDGGANFPGGPVGGVRLALDRRLSSRMVAAFETGLDTGNDSSIPLVDRNGDALANVSIWYHSIPLEGSVRRHFGAGARSPFVSAGGGLRVDVMRWTESMPRDRVEPAAGIGAGVFAGAGLTSVLGPSSALHVEARAVARTVGVRGATLHTENRSDRRLPVDGGTWVGVELHVGWLRELR